LRKLQSKLTAIALLSLLSSYALPQMPAPSAVAPQYNDSDKKKIAEIEQRPDIKDEIQAQWDERRRRDMDYIYNINSSAHFSDLSGPEFATFRDHYGLLYNNPMLQRYLNDIGQRLVPKDSPNIYSFKILLDPIPKAESFSTGTVLVSTGLISMLDNEAQLAYVLGHEIAHVEKNHFYLAVRMSVVEDELNKEKGENIERKRAIFTAAITTATAGIGGGVANGLKGALIAGAIGLGSGAFLSRLLIRDNTTVTEWPDVYENDADETSIGYILDQNYDVREAPKLYARMETAAAHDPRIGLGFIAQAPRMKARNAKIQELLSGTLKSSIESKLKGAGLKGSSGEFNLIMATLKRDNGIIAIDYDLFAMARDNLDEAVSLRTDDARAQLYLGKVISLTARNDQDRQEAEQHFMKAIKYDEARGNYPDPHLEHALHMIGENGDKAEIRKELESYIALYQRLHAGALPNNMPILYDYLTLVGETNWYVAPAEVISTKNVEPIHTSPSGPPSALTGAEVIAVATASSTAAAVAQSAENSLKQTEVSTARSHAAVKKVSKP
jgi:tetratricopeptide (TPR) repeat protein